MLTTVRAFALEELAPSPVVAIVRAAIVRQTLGMRVERENRWGAATDITGFATIAAAIRQWLQPRVYSSVAARLHDVISAP